MTASNDKNQHRQRGVYRQAEFASYVSWKALPSFLRGQPTKVLEKMGIDDEVTISLLEIKSQKEFAARFGIKDQGTLTDWNKRIEKEGLLNDINSWARSLTPNVVLALYKTATKHGKARDVKAWFEIIEHM